MSLTVSSHGGTLFEKTQPLDRAIAEYEKCRTVHLKLFRQNPVAANLANIYVLASLALARAHVSNDSLDQAIAVRDETIQQSFGFPEALTTSQAFLGNMRFLKELKSGAQ